MASKASQPPPTVQCHIYFLLLSMFSGNTLPSGKHAELSCKKSGAEESVCIHTAGVYTYVYNRLLPFGAHRPYGRYTDKGIYACRKMAHVEVGTHKSGIGKAGQPAGNSDRS